MKLRRTGSSPPRRFMITRRGRARRRSRPKCWPISLGEIRWVFIARRGRHNNSPTSYRDGKNPSSVGGGPNQLRALPTNPQGRKLFRPRHGASDGAFVRFGESNFRRRSGFPPCGWLISRQSIAAQILLAARLFRPVWMILFSARRLQ